MQRHSFHSKDVLRPVVAILNLEMDLKTTISVNSEIHKGHVKSCNSQAKM